MEPDVSQRQDGAPGGARGQADPANIRQPTAPAAPHMAPLGPRITHRLASDALDDDEGPPSVHRAAWLRDDDYWRKVTFMSATGRRPGERPTARPLPRPDRFAARSPVRSVAILALVVALIILIPIGVITAERVASQIILPANIPGISQPTAAPPTHTPTVKPTATPRHKK